MCLFVFFFSTAYSDEDFILDMAAVWFLPHQRDLCCWFVPWRRLVCYGWFFHTIAHAAHTISKKSQLAFHPPYIFLSPQVQQKFQISVKENPCTSLKTTIIQDNMVKIVSLTCHIYLAILGFKVPIFPYRMCIMRLGRKLYYMKS